jgi:hypothetical protein
VFARVTSNGRTILARSCSLKSNNDFTASGDKVLSGLGIEQADKLDPSLVVDADNIARELHIK